MINRPWKSICLQLIAAIVFAGAINATAPSPRILFIGNSYTSVNNLPAIFKQIVNSASLPEPTIEASTPGGLTLQQHSKRAATVAKIDEETGMSW